jgi:hypothetical protein
MKQSVIIGSIVAMVILIFVLLYRHSDRPSQAEIRTMTVAQIRELFHGNWAQEDSLGSLVLHSRGTFTRRIYGRKIQQDSLPDGTSQYSIPDGTSQWTYGGTWDVKVGVLVLSISNAVARNTTNVEANGSVDNFRVSKVDGSHLVLERNGITTYFHR